MSNLPLDDEVEQVLKSGLDAAQMLLPQLEEERGQFLRKIMELNGRIGKLKHLIAAFEIEPSGQRLAEPQSARVVPKGARDDTMQALTGADGPLSVQEIVDVIHGQTGRSYAVSTIYAVLQIAWRAGRVLKLKGCRWLINKEPT